MVKSLLEHGADPCAKDDEGATPLDKAKRGAYKRCPLPRNS
ncbi:hypothetical protein CGL51_10705 [Pyrobaculum aerophilum]|uniref:Ankyrin repeat domain-containing protein n=1 Tax=Pyrobaculum aerophilum TaxID=13773 RepID=A0A371QYT8_9CREN|nr:hypothetical protein CGL51_10705 [Pyrobaculum aerophilum]RFA95885.1 hypothetical protein CGL52_11985 [Pyrobaculum aerophilum]HII46093.1 ankyrin repeat domain-containing protein [Pyrobaculum aerophilum]